jgi:hypothetical protein
MSSICCPVSQQVRSLQIDEQLFLAGAPEPEPADFINHSCDPNCALSGSVDPDRGSATSRRARN